MTLSPWCFPWLAITLFSLPIAAQGFREVAARHGLEGVKAKRVAWFDANGNGWPDLLVDGSRVFLSTPGPGGRRIFKRRSQRSSAWRLVDFQKERAHAASHRGSAEVGDHFAAGSAPDPALCG